MERAINNICKVEFVKISELSDYQESPTGRVLISGAWQTMLTARPPRLLVSESVTKAGRLYESNFSVLLENKLLNKNLLIVRISFNDGAEPMIIGDPDLPVRFTESHDIKAKTLTFSHSSWHYPFREAANQASSGSGSGI